MRTRILHAVLGFGFTSSRAILREYVDGYPLTSLLDSDRGSVVSITESLHQAGFAGIDYKPENFVRSPGGILFMVDFLGTSSGAEKADGKIFRLRMEEDKKKVDQLFGTQEPGKNNVEDSRPDVSVIVVNWNTRDLLRDCLSSVEKYSGEIRLELLVVDNGSTDGSADMVSEEFPRVHLLTNKSNRGFARAANQALAQAAGRHCLLLNSDARLLPGTLEQMVSFLDTQLDAGVCAPQLIHEDGTLQNSIANFPTLVTELLNKRLLRLLSPNRFPGKEALPSSPREVESVIGASMMVKAAAMRQVGFLDETFFFFLEETDWCRRFHDSGWKVYFLPSARVVHLQGKTAERVRSEARIEYFRSRYTYFHKYYGPLTMTCLRTGLLVRLSANVIYNGLASILGLLRGRSAERFHDYSRVLLWHLKGCPADGGLERKAS